MAVTDVENFEIVQGPHYHAWALLPSVYRTYNGDSISHLVYTASMQPHRDRSTARRHAKQMAEAAYGRGGYMALLCGGGVACPLIHHMTSTIKVDGEPDAFARSGAKASLTPHHTEKGADNDR